MSDLKNPVILDVMQFVDFKEKCYAILIPLCK